MQALIVKYGEEVLQEEFAMQLIVQFQRIFLETNMPVKLCPYRILAISNKSGKKNCDKFTLKNFFCLPNQQIHWKKMFPPG